MEKLFISNKRGKEKFRNYYFQQTYTYECGTDCTNSQVTFHSLFNSYDGMLIIAHINKYTGSHAICSAEKSNFPPS